MTDQQVAHEFALKASSVVLQHEYTKKPHMSYTDAVNIMITTYKYAYNTFDVKTNCLAGRFSLQGSLFLRFVLFYYIIQKDYKSGQT